MSKILKKWQGTNMTYRLLALACSLALFFNVNNASVRGVFSSRAESYEETAENVPVSLIYDSDKYYVHGYEPTVKVELTSINRVQLATEVNEDTRGFKVVADLTKLGVGTHEVKLRVKDIRDAVTANVEPKTVTVTIEKLVTKSMKVEPVVSSSALADGFKLDKVTANPAKIKITTGEETLKQIDRLTATVDPAKAATEDFSETVNVEALDATGQALSMIAEPEKVRVTVKVTAPQKKVSLKAEQQGTAASGVSSFEITLATDTATISGAESVLDKIDSISVPVNVSGITMTTTKQVEIPTDNYSVDPKVVRVTIKPILTTESSSSGTRSGGTTNSSEKRTTTNNNNTTKKSEPSEESTTQSVTTSDSSEDKTTVEDSDGQ